MDKFEGNIVGIRDMETKKLLAVYPHETTGTNEEIRKKVRDWYYSQDCENEKKLRTSYVDILTKEEEDTHL